MHLGRRVRRLGRCRGSPSREETSVQFLLCLTCASGHLLPLTQKGTQSNLHDSLLLHFSLTSKNVTGPRSPGKPPRQGRGGLCPWAPPSPLTSTPGQLCSVISVQTSWEVDALCWNCQEDVLPPPNARRAPAFPCAHRHPVGGWISTAKKRRLPAPSAFKAGLPVPTQRPALACPSPST